MDSTKLTASDVGARHVRICRCPGYAINGNTIRCHADEEPGGYDVGLGLMLLNQLPMTLDEANEYAAEVAHWVGIAVDYDRRGVTDTQIGPHLPFPWPPETFDWGPGACGTEGTKILRRMVNARGRLTNSRRRAGIVRFEVDGECGPNMRTVPWDEVMILERGGYILREPSSDRERGARVLTDFGRKEAAR